MRGSYLPLVVFPSVLAALGAVSLASGLAEPNTASDLILPEGFEAVQFSGRELANDIYCMTLDPKGRPVVSGRGYIRILSDDDGDGVADRAIPFSEEPSDGAQGLLWEGDRLYFTGGGGLRVLYDRDGDDRADGPSELIRSMKTGDEHGSHAIRRGPDGLLYVMLGNMTAIDETFAELPTSPIKDPIAGRLIRFSPDLSKTEVVADGFRNAYDFDFDLDGGVFTYDSDNERDVSLPYYEPTRAFRVLEGGHHGWQTPQNASYWKKPYYFPDVVAPIATGGRGSPCGVECYRHNQFPERYQGGIFIEDWTYGIVYFLPEDKEKKIFRDVQPEAEIFIEPDGTAGFAWTDLCVHPGTGDLYLCVGGRGTRGAVYRVRHTERFAELGPDGLKPLATRPDAKIDKAVEFPGPKAGNEVVTGLAAAGRIEEGAGSIQERIDELRLLQICLGDLMPEDTKGTVWEGYSPRVSEEGTPLYGWTEEELTKVSEALLAAFPTGEWRLDRELSRTLAMIAPLRPESQDTRALDEIAAKWTADSDPIEDIQYLIVFAQLRGARSPKMSRRAAGALLDLDEKLREREMRRDSSWPRRIEEILERLSERDPNLKTALLDNPDFGRSDHVLYASIPGLDRNRAARAFQERARTDEDFEWTAPVLEIVAEAFSFEEAAPILRAHWSEWALRPTILVSLAEHPTEEDLDLFLEGLSGFGPNTTERCLDALESMPPFTQPERIGKAISAIRVPLGDNGKPAERVQERLGVFLGTLTGEDFGVDGKAWGDWFEKTHPGLSSLTSRLTRGEWETRLEGLDWDSADSERGEEVARRLACTACHLGSGAMGPPLEGIGSRFSREDLLVSILQPSRDVSSQFRPTRVETIDGNVYGGFVVYKAVDSLLLREGPDKTVRVPGDDIVRRWESEVSMMPEGLLDELNDREVADLFAYLEALK